MVSVGPGASSAWSSRRKEVQRWSQLATSSGAASVSSGPRRHDRELFAGFHGGGGEHGQLHDAGEEPRAIAVPVLCAETRL